ncbi:MAG: hypothetical protein DBX41_03475 [Clostridiales bacterium]|nr:MAG: hypothetical protein DBX41_03475 [Clostridiales bacterium]
MVKKRIYLTKRQYKIAKYIYKKEPDEAQLREKFKLSEEECAALLESLAEILTIGADNRLRLNEKGLVAYEEKHERESIRRLAWTALWITVGISAAALAVSIVAIAIH